MMIPVATIPKKIPINFNFMALLKMMASGRLSAETAIMNARAVPNGTPLSKRTAAIGNIAAQLPYIGTPKITAKGTVNMPPWPISF